MGSQAVVIDWTRIGVAIWLFGSAITLLVSAWRIIRFQLMLREAEPAGEEMQDRVDELALKLGVASPPSVWWISGVLSPMVWAVGGRPRLLIPVDFWKSLDERQRSTLLAHELAHLCRGDHLVRFLELAVTALYWWNPVVWAARRALAPSRNNAVMPGSCGLFPKPPRPMRRLWSKRLTFLTDRDPASRFSRAASAGSAIFERG